MGFTVFGPRSALAAEKLDILYQCCNGRVRPTRTPPCRCPVPGGLPFSLPPAQLRPPTLRLAAITVRATTRHTRLASHPPHIPLNTPVLGVRG